MRRGFTLTETVVVVAIISLAAMLSIPLVSRMQNREELREAGREVLRRVARARSLARSREGRAAWAEDMVVQRAGLRWASARTLEVYIDGDEVSDGANEVVVETLRLHETVTVDDPGQELRYKRNGTLEATADLTLRLHHASGDSLSVFVPFSGSPRLQR